jgi:hypothetical protein
MAITFEERELARDRLTATRDRLHAMTSGLTPAQWSYRDGEAWSILLILEHVYIVEAGALKRIASAPPSPDVKLGRDAKVMSWVTDRSRKVISPEMVTPQGRVTDPAELLAKFDRVRSGSLGWLEDPTADHRAHAMPHPFLGVLDGYQWLLFFAQHLERHLAQVEETKAHPHFP